KCASVTRPAFQTASSASSSTGPIDVSRGASIIGPQQQRATAVAGPASASVSLAFVLSCGERQQTQGGDEMRPWLGLVALACGLLLGACGNDEESGPNGGGGGEAGTTGFAGAGGDGGGGGEGGTGRDEAPG